MQERKENSAKREKEEEAIEKIIDKSKMDIPDAMVETQTAGMLNDFAGRMAQQGLSLEQYMQFTGMTMEKLQEQMKEDALKRIRTGLVLEQIAKEEDIQVSDEEIEAEVVKMAEMYGMNADDLKNRMGDEDKESIKKDLAVQKAVELIMENVKEKAKPKSKKEKEDDTEEEE